MSQTPRPSSTFLRRLRHVAVDAHAVSAVEFALLLPLLLTLYIAGNEVTQALMIYRKLTHAGSTLGDLVAQTESGSNTTGTVDSTAMSGIFDATSMIMSPYDTSSARMVVADVLYTTSGGYKTQTSCAKNTTAWSTNASPPITIPTGLVSDKQHVIVTRSTYTYVSAFSTFMKDIWGSGSITLEDVSYFRPRLFNDIKLTCP